MEREDAEYLVSAGYVLNRLSIEDLKQVRFCHTPKSNSNCQYSILGCKFCSEYKTEKTESLKRDMIGLGG